MRVLTETLLLLLLGTAVAAPPGLKDPAPPIGSISWAYHLDRAPPMSSSRADGKLPVRPAGQASSSKAGINKQLKLGDIYDVISGKKKDSCDQYYDAKAEPGKSDKLLNQYWDQVYIFTVAGKRAIGEQYEVSAEKRKLVESFFGIKSEKGGKVTVEGLDGEAVDMVEEFHARMFKYITTPRSGKDRPILSCGSTAMKFQKSTDLWKDEQGKDTKMTIYRELQQYNERYDDWWIWWNENTKEYTITERTEYEKEVLGNGPDVTPYEGLQDPTKADPCTGRPKHTGFTSAGYPDQSFKNAFHKRVVDHQSVVVLCPNTFKLQVPGLFPQHVMHNLDNKPHAVGTELLYMQTNAITLYHEMYHLVIDTSMGGHVTPDSLAAGAKKNPEGKAYPAFPAEKEYFSTRQTFALGPVQCMYLALWDKATPREQSVNRLEATANPESYAWFGLTNALNDLDKMDWSSGKAMAAGSAYKGVWTSNADHTTDPQVPFDTTGESPNCADPAQEGGMTQAGSSAVQDDSSDWSSEESCSGERRIPCESWQRTD